MRSLYVPLSDQTREQLRELAQREYRRPRDQARVILERAVQAAYKPPAEAKTKAECEPRPA